MYVREFKNPGPVWGLGLLLLFAAGCPYTGGGYYDDDDDDSAAASDDDDAECVEHTECRADELCHQSECELVFGRSFEFVFWGADVEPLDEDGANWDVTGAPDPYGVVSVAGEELARTSVGDDSFSFDWEEPLDVVVTQEFLCIEVWDEDLVADDLMDATCFETPDAVVDLVRSQDFVSFLTQELVFIDVEILPNF